MVIKPKIRGFFCLTSHPEGCAAHVAQQIDYVKGKGPIPNGPKKVLVIGASTGYGLASRITAAFGSQAGTLGVFFEKEPTARKPATAGWYNSVALERAAHAEGLYAKSINGDAFSDHIKTETIEMVRDGLGQVDLVVYSVASPRRTHPRTGEVAHSTLKPLAKPYHGMTLDTDKRVVKPITIEPATEEETADTIAVMGAEDWEMWMEALDDAGALADGCRAISYTYIGSEVTWPIYRSGTIGKAKEDLERGAQAINRRLSARGGSAHIGVMKALVTQSSSAIPVVPLYISLLYRVMKEKGLHEGCIEQIQRLFATRLYGDGRLAADQDGLIHLDDWEMRDDVQEAMRALWPTVTSENLETVSDFAGYREDFLRLFGFGLSGVDYEADIDPIVRND
jgi:enoyl-[acyl-carrier protein] reductase/trans-2-enoyl-CoA reductase (NAD+)